MTAIIRAADGYVPTLAGDVFLAEGSAVVGNVDLKSGVNIWYGAVLRADAGTIRVGIGSSIQEQCVLRAKVNLPLEIGAFSSIAEGTIIRGAKIGDGVLVGPGCVILEGASIGDGCIIAAGTLIPRGVQIPANTFARGRPAKIVRELSDEDRQAGRKNAEEQARLAQMQKS